MDNGPAQKADTLLGQHLDRVRNGPDIVLAEDMGYFVFTAPPIPFHRYNLAIVQRDGNGGAAVFVAGPVHGHPDSAIVLQRLCFQPCDARIGVDNVLLGSINGALDQIARKLDRLAVRAVARAHLPAEANRVAVLGDARACYLVLAPADLAVSVVSCSHRIPLELRFDGVTIYA